MNREIFCSLKEAQVLVAHWHRDYNTIRPHSSLGYRPPAPQAVRPRENWLSRPVLQGTALAAGLTRLVVPLLRAGHLPACACSTRPRNIRVVSRGLLFTAGDTAVSRKP